MINGEPPGGGSVPLSRPRENPLSPNPSDGFYKQIAANLAKVPYWHLVSGVPPRTKNVPSESQRPALELMMLQEARMIDEDSSRPESLTKAHWRNIQLAKSTGLQIQDGDLLHGMPVVHFSNARHGILAPEFYGGETKTVEQIYSSLYVSQVIGKQISETPEQIINQSHTAGFGLQLGTVIIIFDKGAPLTNLHGTIVGIVKPRSVAKAISVGESLTDVKSCVVAHPEDIPEIKKILVSLKMYIPLYNLKGNILFTHQEWLVGQKKAL